MRAGLVISTALHAALLGYGLLALSAPPPLQVADVEAFPVDIVPVEQVSRVQQGDKKAPVAEKSAPKPTPRPDPVPQARNVGNNTVDNDSAPTPQAKPREVKTAAAPKPTPEPTPKPAPQPEQTASTAEPKPAPATEQTVKEQPKQEVAPDPVKQAAVAENPDAAPVKLPTVAPAPQARPQPPQAQTAKAPERKVAEKPAEKPTQQPKADKPDDTLDEVAALLSKEAPSGGGAKRSTETAALGGRRTTEGVKLSQSEEDALRQQLSGCWSIPAGADGGGGLRTTVRFNLNRDGRLDGRPVVQNPSGNQQFDESAVRAVQKCDQVGLLVPKGKYEVWAEVLVNFDPSEMF
jgi:colicin import membrane protein